MLSNVITERKTQSGVLLFWNSKIAKNVPSVILLLYQKSETQQTHRSVKATLCTFLKYKKKKPVTYLPLDGDTISGTTVTEDGVTGTIHDEAKTQIQTGKVNQGLHVSNGGRFSLSGTTNRCISDLAACADGLSISLWINPSYIPEELKHISHSRHSINIATNGGLIRVWTNGPSTTLHSIGSQSMTVGTRTHVFAVFSPDVGLFLYINGRLDAFSSIYEENSNSYNADKIIIIYWEFILFISLLFEYCFTYFLPLFFFHTASCNSMHAVWPNTAYYSLILTAILWHFSMCLLIPNLKRAALAFDTVF